MSQPMTIPKITCDMLVHFWLVFLSSCCSDRVPPYETSFVPSRPHEMFLRVKSSLHTSFYIFRKSPLDLSEVVPVLFDIIIGIPGNVKEDFEKENLIYFTIQYKWWLSDP